MSLHQAPDLDAPAPALLTEGTVLLAIDTETGGLDPARHAITQIGFVGVIWREGLGPTAILPLSFAVNIIPNARLEVTEEALRVQGHTRESLAARADAVPEAEAARLLAGSLSRYPGAPLIAHNAKFDAGFLRELGRRTGIPIPTPRPLICTKERQSLLQRQSIVPKGSARLADCVKALGLEQVENQHDASADAALTLRLFLWQEAQRRAATGSLEGEAPRYLWGQVGTIGEVVPVQESAAAAPAQERAKVPAHEEPLPAGIQIHQSYRDLAEAAGQPGFPDLRGIHIAEMHHTIDDTERFVQGTFRLMARQARALALVGRIAKEKGWKK